MTKLSDEELRIIRFGHAGGARDPADCTICRLLDSHASLEAEVLRLRGLLQARALGEFARRVDAGAPTSDAPPSRSVQRRLAAQGVPTSGQLDELKRNLVAAGAVVAELREARKVTPESQTEGYGSAPTSGQGAAATCASCGKPMEGERFTVQASVRADLVGKTVGRCCWPPDHSGEGYAPGTPATREETPPVARYLCLRCGCYDTHCRCAGGPLQPGTIPSKPPARGPQFGGFDQVAPGMYVSRDPEMRSIWLTRGEPTTGGTER